MSKYYGILFSLLLLAASSVEGWQTLRGEVKAGYFYPTGDTFRKIYSGGGIYGGELSMPICDPLDVWISGSYFTRKGSSINLHHHTRIDLIPLAIGLKYYVPWNCIDFYVGAGFQYTHLKTYDDSPFVIHEVEKWWFPGGIAKVGAIIDLECNWFLDFFIDYSFLKMDFHKTHHGRVERHKADLSGWTFGVGLGYNFCDFCLF